MSIFTPTKHTDDDLLLFKAQIIKISNKLDLINLPQNNLKTLQGDQFYFSGVFRRLSIIRENYRYLIEICPPDRIKYLEEAEAAKAAVHLNSLYLHIWGCIDNLAWIIAYEVEYGVIENKGSRHMSDKGKINLFPSLNQKKKENLRTFITNRYKNLECILIAFDEWIKELGGIRHPAAHRMPLQIVPYFLRQDRTKKWLAKWRKYIGLLDKEMIENSPIFVEKAEKIRKSIGDLGEFYPIFALEMEYDENGKIQSESFNFLYPTIVDDCANLLNLIEKLVKFLESR